MVDPELREGATACLTDTLADVDRITKLTDPVLRNLWITERYHELSRGLAEVVDGNNVNWSTFATWASKTAGESIRNQEVPAVFLALLNDEQSFKNKLPRAYRIWLSYGPLRDTALLDRLRDVLRSVSHQVAEGNLKVFAELAPIFARFIDDMKQQRVPSQATIDAFSARLKAGASAEGGQELLREAFRHYYDARFSAQPDRKAELILLGNCKIGLHEQTRLQPNIKAAMDAPIAEIFAERVKGSMLLSFLARTLKLLGWPLEAVLDVIKQQWEAVATRYAMNLSLPSGKELDLGSDLPPRRHQQFPKELTTIELPELKALLSRFDPNLASLSGSRANNWAKLDDRMRFIVELFRSRQKDNELFKAPFTPDQLTELHAGRVPPGPL